MDSQNFVEKNILFNVRPSDIAAYLKSYLVQNHDINLVFGDGIRTQGLPIVIYCNNHESKNIVFLRPTFGLCSIFKFKHDNGCNNINIFRKK